MGRGPFRSGKPDFFAGTDSEGQQWRIQLQGALSMRGRSWLRRRNHISGDGWNADSRKDCWEICSAGSSDKNGVQIGFQIGQK